jgi:hypothetical protein
MAKHALATKARLKLQLDNEILLGTAGGEHLHCLVQCPSDPSSGTTIGHGVYSVMPPIEHPLLGRIAILTHLTETADTAPLGARTSVGSGLTYTLSHAHGAAQHALAGRVSFTLTNAAANNALASSPTSRGTLILTRGPLSGSNVIVVTTGFEDLMDHLEESGGGTVEIMP